VSLYLIFLFSLVQIDVIVADCARGSDVKAVEARAPDGSRDIAGVIGKGEAEAEVDREPQ
jgi:hypothetical protein